MCKKAIATNNTKMHLECLHQMWNCSQSWLQWNRPAATTHNWVTKFHKVVLTAQPLLLSLASWPGLAGSADAQGDRHCLAFTHISVLLFPSASCYTGYRCQCLPARIKCWGRELWQGQPCARARSSVYIHVSFICPPDLSVFCLSLEFLIWEMLTKTKRSCHQNA